MVVRWRDLDDVHPRQLDPTDDPADRPEQLAAREPAGLGRAGSGCESRIDDVDIEAEVDRVRSVERLGDRIVDDRLGPALLDLRHEVVAKAVLLHPFECLDRRPVSAQPDLDEVLALNRTRLDEPPHRRPVAREDAPIVVGRIRMGIEMDDSDAAGPADLGDRGRARPGDRVVAAEDDGDGPRRGHLADLAVDHGMGTLDPGGDDVRIPGVDDRQELERLDPELERVHRARRVLRLADGARAEPSARPVADGIVEWGADDGDIDLA
jgi:hypothetical protein